MKNSGGYLMKMRLYYSQNTKGDANVVENSFPKALWCTGTRILRRLQHAQSATARDTMTKIATTTM